MAKSVDEEKASDKFQHPFMTKNSILKVEIVAAF